MTKFTARQLRAIRIFLAETLTDSEIEIVKSYHEYLWKMYTLYDRLGGIKK